MNGNAPDGLDSDALIRFIRAKQDAGDLEAAQRALGVLCFRHYEDVKRRVSLKVPRADIEDVAMEVMASAVKSAFDGTAVGQFVSWLNTIVDRRIADYHRRREGKPVEVPLPEEHQEAEEIWGEAATVDPDEPATDVLRATDRALPENPVHRRVVELSVFGELEGQEVVDRVNEEFPDLDPAMSVANVHQILSRFRKDLRELLEDDGA